MQTSDGLRQRAATVMQRGGARMPHPATVILLWIFLAIAMQFMSALTLGLVGTLLTAIAMTAAGQRWYILLRRMRWIMLSLLAVYGYMTPGEALWGPLGMLSPTGQGVLDGLLQLFRLVFMVAGVSVVLAVLPQRDLVAGLYTLAYPLRLPGLGLSRERVAVRLALTLRYAESLPDAKTDWRGSLGRLLEPAADVQDIIELPAHPVTVLDSLLVVAGGALLALVLL